MNHDTQNLVNDMEFVRETIVKPFDWLAIGLTVLMILPKFSTFPDYEVTYWHVFAAIIVGCVVRVAGSCWVSRRFDRKMKLHYPELYIDIQESRNEADA